MRFCQMEEGGGGSTGMGVSRPWSGEGLKSRDGLRMFEGRDELGLSGNVTLFGSDRAVD